MHEHAWKMHGKCMKMLQMQCKTLQTVISQLDPSQIFMALHRKGQRGRKHGKDQWQHIVHEAADTHLEG